MIKSSKLAWHIQNTSCRKLKTASSKSRLKKACGYSLFTKNFLWTKAILTYQTLGSTTSWLYPSLSCFSSNSLVVDAHELSFSRSPRNSDTRLSLDSTPRVRVATSARRMSQRVSRISSLVLMVSELGLERVGLDRSRSAVCWMLFFESSLLFCSCWTPCGGKHHSIIIWVT